MLKTTSHYVNLTFTLLWPTGSVYIECKMHKFSFAGTGISTDVQTSYAARIMGISVIPFIIAQFPKMLKTHHGQRLAVLLALIVSFSLVLAYCLYQVSTIMFKDTWASRNDGIGWKLLSLDFDC